MTLKILKTKIKKSDNDIKNSHEFFDEGYDEQKFEDELKEDFFKQLDLIKTKDEYVEPTVQDTEIIEKETKKEDNEFLELATKFNEVNIAATEQKKHDHFDRLIYDIFDNKPILDASPKIEDIFINDDCLFDESDEQETKDISNDIINNTNTNEVLLEDLPEPKFVVQDKSIKKCLTK